MTVLGRLPWTTAIVVLLAIPAIIAQQIWLPSSAGVFILGALPSAIAVVVVGAKRALQIAVAAAIGGARLQRSLETHGWEPSSSL